MNIETTIHADQPLDDVGDEADGPTGTALATLENIDDICAGRDRAIDLWVEAHRGFHTSMDAIARASIAGAVPCLSFQERYSTDDGALGEAWSQTGLAKVWRDPPEGERWLGRKQVEINAEDLLREVVTAKVDRRCWVVMSERLGLDQLLDRQARDEFKLGLKGTPPPFTPDNVRATFETVWGQRREIYLRGVANVFMTLDRRFRSHDAFEIGARVVFSYALADGGRYWNSRNAESAIQDVERIFYELEGRRRPGYGRSITDQLTRGVGRYEDEYFKADAFKNRNVHLWMKRKDLLREVNKLLIEYYKPVEGDVAEGGPTYEAGPLFHQTPAKHYGFFPSPQAVVDAVIERASLYGRERFSGRYADEWTPDTVLEPSAGTGALAKAARANGHQVSCIEIQPHLAALLRSQGFSCLERDFLQVEPSDLGLFDRVIMNPPFDRGRDCDHVRHAFRFLKPGGTLVAVMSARAEFATDKRHAALHDLIAQNRGRWDGRETWEDLPERSFAESGTNVNTVTLKITRRTDNA